MITGSRLCRHWLFSVVAACIFWTAASGQESSGPPSDITGVWRSVGYGVVIDIRREDYTAYEVTSVSAVKSLEGKTALIQEELGVVALAETENRLAVSLPFTLTPIEFERIDELPDVCSDTRDLTNPVSLFDIVWHTFNEQYAFFELRNIDWSAEYQKWRPKVTTKTTDEDLFRILASMVSTLNDNHVMIQADGFDYSRYQRVRDFPLVRQWRGQYEAERRDTHFMQFARGKYEEYVGTSRKRVAGQLVAPLTMGANDMVAWGVFPNQVGYLNVRSMAGYCEDEDGAAQLAALEKAVDRAMIDLSKVRAMIVDIRFNGGGWDNASLLIASRFADTRRAVLSKQARAGDAFATRHTVHVDPSGPRQFTRPVVLLTSPMTVSAAEIFTYCMNAFPHVTQAGLPTMGIHSDMLERHLPNGWQFYLSNEVYRSAKGEVREKVGITPAHHIQMFTLKDFDNGKDQTIVQVLKLTETLLDR